MNPDLLSVVVRTLALAGVLQAAGAAFFVVLFGPWLLRSGQRIRRLGYQAALAGMALLAALVAACCLLNTTLPGSNRVASRSDLKWFFGIR